MGQVRASLPDAFFEVRDPAGYLGSFLGQGMDDE